MYFVPDIVLETDDRAERKQIKIVLLEGRTIESHTHAHTHTYTFFMNWDKEQYRTLVCTSATSDLVWDQREVS